MMLGNSDTGLVHERQVSTSVRVVDGSRLASFHLSDLSTPVPYLLWKYVWNTTTHDPRNGMAHGTGESQSSEWLHTREFHFTLLSRICVRYGRWIGVDLRHTPATYDVNYSTVLSVLCVLYVVRDVLILLLLYYPHHLALFLITLDGRRKWIVCHYEYDCDSWLWGCTDGAIPTSLRSSFLFATNHCHYCHQPRFFPPHPLSVVWKKRKRKKK